MDAISFVLGVRTAKLRGTQLTDLVYKFSDEELEKGGPINCFVRLVFIHQGEEIIFQRSIKIDSKASEYRINKKVVSYEDYENRLASFNILVQTKNFLVFQGDVESVASKSPKELTELIEQISGSIAYKEEYDSLSKARDEAIENANFIIKKQKGIRAEKKQFKQQKDEALYYNQLKEKLLESQVEHILYQLYYIEKDLEDQEEDKEKKIVLLDKIHEKQTKDEAKQNEVKKRLASIQNDMNKFRRDMETKRLVIDTVGPKTIKLDKEIEHIIARIEKSKKALENLNIEKQKQKSSIQSYEEELQEIELHEKLYLSKFEEEEKKLVQLDDEQLRELVKIKEKARTASSVDRQALLTIESIHNTECNAQNQIKSSIEDLSERKVKIQESLLLYEERKQQVEGVLSNIVTELNKNKDAHAECISLIDDARSKHIKLTSQLKTVQDSLRIARVELSDMARRDKSLETLENLKRLYPSVCGRVIDLIQPSLNKYKIPVTVTIGIHMDSIVVNDESTALECIRYMREQRLGVATFLPLDTIKAFSPNDKLRALKNAQLVIDVLNYDEKYKKVAEFVCGDTLVTSDLTNARSLAFSKDRYKVVTLDGTMIQKSGLMTGGISGIESKSKRWDEKDIEKLKLNRDKIQQELTESTQVLKNINKEQQLEASIRDAEARYNNVSFDLETLQTNMKKEQKLMEDLDKKIHELQSEYDEIQERMTRREVEIDSLRKKIHNIEDSLYKDFSQKVGIQNIREYDEKRKKIQKEKAEKVLATANQRSRIQNLLEYQRTRDISSTITEIEQNVEEDEALLVKLKHQAKKETKEITKLNQEVEKLKVELANETSSFQEVQGELRSIKKDLETRTNLIHQKSKEISSKDALISQLKQKRHNILNQCRLDDIDLPGSKFPEELEEERMELESGDGSPTYERDDQIELDYSVLKSKYKNLKTQQQRDEVNNTLLEEIRSYESKLDQIAPNLKAIERLQTVKEKMDECDKDLTNARDEARKKISKFTKIQKKRSEAFTKSYDHISNVIDPIYKKLTNHFGVAHLTLESTEEPYLHGIRYNAVPRNKTFRDIEDLSGGEKSVAALALLFAIHSYKPSPFFVLDEVDAALDTNNVSIVAKYFKERSKDLQFIVISLKDKCFDKADSLVGIYIDREEDCSKTLTLDLRKYEQ